MCTNTMARVNSTENSVCTPTDKPVLYAQCDWEEVLRTVDAKIWVNAKTRGCPNVEGKIQSISIDKQTGYPILKCFGGFTGSFITRNILQVKHEDSGVKILFLAPNKVYSDIHKKAVRSLDVSTTGLSLSYSDDGNLLVWDFTKGELKIKLEGHIGDVYKCKFFPSQKVVLSCGADMQLKIWCVESGYCVSIKGHKRAVTDFAIVDAGKNVVSVSKDGSVKLWNCGDASCLGTLASASSDINCCAITTVPETFPVGEPSSPPSDLEVGTKNKVVVYGCEDGIIAGVAVYSRKKLFGKLLDSPVNSVSFLGEQDDAGNKYKFVVGCQSGKILLFDLNNVDAPLNTLHDSNNAILRVIMFDNSGFLVSDSGGAVYYVLNNLQSKIFSLTGSNYDPIYDITTDGRFVYTACRDSVIRRYSLEKSLKDERERFL